MPASLPIPSFLAAVALSLAALFCPASASAWNAAGHRLTVAVAWPDLSEPTRKEIDGILLAHPAIDSWRARVAREPWSGALLAEASTWPDDIRRGERERAEREGVAVDDELVHREWHFIDRAIGQPPDNARGGQLDRQIPRLARLVADRTAKLGERAVALAWLVHLVGDAHMPLHTATWRDANGEWTAGGNGVAVTDPFNPRLPETNLHRYWDDLPGVPWLRGHRLLKRATALRAAHPASASPQGSSADWIDESHALAIDIARKSAGDPLIIDERYRADARAIADQQVARAGARLARLLESLLGP
jgi:hypothetical protein